MRGRSTTSRTRTGWGVRVLLAGALVLASLALGVPTASAAEETVADVAIAATSTTTQKSGSDFTYTLTLSCDQLGDGSGTEADTCEAPTVTIPLGSDLAALITTGDFSAADVSVGTLMIDGVDHVVSYDVVGTDLVVTLDDLPVGWAGTLDLTLTPRNGVTPDGTGWSLLPTLSGTNFADDTAPTAATGEATASLTAAITKSIGGSGFKDIGDAVEYTIQVECTTASTGMIYADSLTVTDAIPSEIDYVSSSPSASVSGSTLTWTISGSDLPTSCTDDSPAAPRYVTFTVEGTVNSTAVYGDKVTNTATVTGTTTDGQTMTQKQATASLTVVNESTAPSTGIGTFSKASFGQLRDDDASASSSASGLEANSHTTYPGDWAGALSAQSGNVLSGYVPNQATGMTQAGYKMRFTTTTTNGAGYQHQITDPMPCLTNVSGSVYSSYAAGSTLCTDVAFHATTASVWSSTSGGVAALDTAWAPTVRYTDGTSGTLVRTGGGTNYANFGLDPADAGKTIAEVTFPRAEGLSGPDVRWAVFGYVDDAVPDLSLVKNVAEDLLYYKAATTPAGVLTDDADLRVVEAPQVGIEKTMGGLASAGAGLSTMTLTTRFTTFGTATDDLVVTDLLPEGMTVDSAPSSATATVTTTTSGAPSSITSDSVEVLDNWQGTGRQLLRITFARSTLAPLGTSMLKSTFSLDVAYPSDPGTYTNTAQVYYTDSSLMSSCQQSPAYLQQNTEDADLNENGSLTDAYCYSQASITVPPPSGGASFRTAKTVQGDGDSAPKSYPAIGRVDEAGGTVTFGLSWRNTGGVNLHGAVIYDVFPAVGDTGVGGSVAGQARNSDFAATFVSLGTLPSGVSVEYSQAANPCRDEVYPDSENTGCVDDWSTSAPSDVSTVTAIRLTSSVTYAPGEGFAVDVDMTTPAIDAGEIAWNSIAGAAKTPLGLSLTNSPPKVGITASSTTLPLLIDKTLDSSIDPDTVRVGDTLLYHLTVSNPDLVTRTIDGTDTLPTGLVPQSIVGTSGTPTSGVSMSGQVITWSGVDIPSGATYTWDVEVLVTPGAVGTATNQFQVDGGQPASKCTVLLGSAADDTACATIVVPPVVLSLSKTVDGAGAAFAPSSFAFQVQCTVSGASDPVVDETVDLGDGDSTDVEVPQDSTCTVTETDDGGATSTSVTVDGSPYTYGDPIAVADTDVAVAATNTFDVGSVVIHKVVRGVGASLASAVTFSVACTFDGRDVAGYSPASVTLTPSGAGVLTSDELGPLPLGASCEVTETSSGGADAVAAPVTVDVTGTAVVARLVNRYSAGTVSVTKRVTGGGTPTREVFPIAVTCTSASGSTVLSRTVRVADGQTVTVADASGSPVLLPVGTSCWAEELKSGGADTVTVDHPASSPVTVVAGRSGTVQGLGIHVVNHFAVDRGVSDNTSSTDGPASDSGSGLPNLGGPGLWVLIAGLLLVLWGGGMLVWVRKRS
ncbi:DUF5979 domain-containing protein [Nocardioides sp. GY 10127]|uniref:DUF5979 domain-containing protein n=1 Tax=Nocardioides sp. GY 10127 TaxID=2569762 RepID=UPI0010A7B193|nr:DUF5979 domain-containing protein [Nocardioides sp. GY 10127]TIC79474.1 isopeptide-forming domain-containing fimbrial protein [Nocardioides sp. GY 10127]